VFALAVIATWEGRAPRRPPGVRLRARWCANFAVWVLDSLLLRLVAPAAGLGIAVLVARRGGGLLPYLGAPSWIAFPVSVLALDLSAYVEHWLLHRVPVLWRLHRMHHADQEYDFTVGFRFHPVESLLALAFNVLTVVVLGPPVLAVFTYQLLTSVSSMFVHGNVRMPLLVDAVLRRLVVTPDLHRVHHSAAMRESSSNLGGLVPWWDRLFGTYIEQPAAGHDRMTIGLGGPADPRTVNLGWMLVDPFRSTEAPLPTLASLDRTRARPS
jgi:sterol desaturase/sphingolipid hydroxylase (fatty acid hydroxylase superfamily)